MDTELIHLTKQWRALLIALVPIVVAGCATLAGDATQPIMVITTCKGSTKVVESVCTLSNDRGLWIIKTPGTVLVGRSHQDLFVVCTRKNENIRLQLVSSSNTGMVSNVAIGGVLGVVVDMHTGAGYDYKKDLKIEFDCTEQ